MKTETPQSKMAAVLAASGIASKEIRVYGRQIVITSLCSNTAARWETLLATFAKVRCTVRAIDVCKANRGTTLKPTTQSVYRTFAQVSA